MPNNSVSAYNADSIIGKQSSLYNQFSNIGDVSSYMNNLSINANQATKNLSKTIILPRDRDKADINYNINAHDIYKDISQLKNEYLSDSLFGSKIIEHRNNYGVPSMYNSMVNYSGGGVNPSLSATLALTPSSNRFRRDDL